MKIVLFVTHPTRTVGAMDYPVSDELAMEIYERQLGPYASKWFTHDKAAPNVHRLQVADATDDAILDALGVLKHQVEMSQAWARRTLLDPHTRRPRIPQYVGGLWEKYPVRLYRDLLGPSVAAAINQCLRASGDAAFEAS